MRPLADASLGRPWTIRPRTIHTLLTRGYPSFSECVLNSDRLCSDWFNSDKVQTVFKALNLFLKKYVTEIQLAGYSSCHKGSTHCSTMARHWWLTSQNVKNEGSSIDRSLQLSIFAQTLGTRSPIKLPSQCKTCFPAAFLKLIWARWQSGQYLCLPRKKKTEKGNGLHSVEIHRRWSEMPSW